MTTATQVANKQVLEWAHRMLHIECLPWLRRNTTCLASVASKNKAQVKLVFEMLDYEIQSTF
jgi:hypothetical protein